MRRGCSLTNKPISERSVRLDHRYAELAVKAEILLSPQDPLPLCRGSKR